MIGDESSTFAVIIRTLLATLHLAATCIPYPRVLHGSDKIDIIYASTTVCKLVNYLIVNFKVMLLTRALNGCSNSCIFQGTPIHRYK